MTTRRRVALAYHGAFRALRARSPESCLLPDVFVLGYAKCASSTVFDLLVQHPSILRGTAKEVAAREPFGPLDLDHYRAQFPHRLEYRAVEVARRRKVRAIDASPRQIDTGTFEQIHGLSPSARHVVLVRNPTERAISEYHHLLRTKELTAPYAEALDPTQVDPALLDAKRWDELAHGGPLSDHPHFALNAETTDFRTRLLAAGCYARTLAKVFEVIPREQVMVIRTRDLRDQPGQTWSDILEHLRLDPMDLPDRAPTKVGDYDRDAVPAEVRAQLETLYAPWNERLENLLGRPFW